MNNNYERQPSGEYAKQLTATYDLIWGLRAVHQYIHDMKHYDFVQGINNRLTAVPAGQSFIVHDEMSSVAPESYHQLYWLPQISGTDITHALTRIPNILPRKDRMVWNDTLIEIGFVRGAPKKYLLNSGGLQPYGDARVEIEHKYSGVQGARIEEKGSDLDYYQMVAPDTQGYGMAAQLNPGDLRALLGVCDVVPQSQFRK